MRITRRTFAAATAAAGFLPRRARAADTIPIGGMLETSGFLAGLGNQGLEGAQLALEQINAHGGLGGKMLALVNINTESDESKSVTTAHRLIERDAVVGIIGAMNSGSNMAIVDTVQRAEMPLISNGAARSIVTPAAERTWIFQAPLNDILAIRVSIAHMKKTGFSRIALINADSAFGLGGLQAWQAMAPAAGITIVGQQTYGNLDQDMTPQLTNLRGKDAQAVVLWGTGPGQSIVARNFRQLGFTVPLYASHGAADPNLIRLAGEAANGIIFPASKLYVAAALPDSDPQKVLITQFAKDFAAKYGRPPSTFAGNGFDAMRILAAGIAGGGTDRPKIRAAIEGLKDFPGITGVYTYSPTDHFGITDASVVMLTIKAGAFAMAA